MARVGEHKNIHFDLHYRVLRSKGTEWERGAQLTPEWTAFRGFSASKLYTFKENAESSSYRWSLHPAVEWIFEDPGG